MKIDVSNPVHKKRPVVPAEGSQGMTRMLQANLKQAPRKISTMNVFAQLALSTTLFIAVPLSAHAAAHSAAPAAAAVPMSEGEIRKVDKDAGKITIRHGDLKNLDMPPMTMVFQVTDPAMLDKVKAGDKVGFVAEKIEGRYAVTQIEVRN